MIIVRMLTYENLKTNPREFLSLTTLEVTEFEALLPSFAKEYQASLSATLTRTGKPRQRQAGGGNKPKLASLEDKLLFILVYTKLYLLQTAQGVMFGMSQAQTNEWIHRLAPLLSQALARLGHLPERNGAAFEQSGGAPDVPPDLMIDGTERRRQRPQDAQEQKEAYSGKKRPIPIKTCS